MMSEKTYYQRWLDRKIDENLAELKAYQSESADRLRIKRDRLENEIEYREKKGAVLISVFAVSFVLFLFKTLANLSLNLLTRAAIDKTTALVSGGIIAFLTLLLALLTLLATEVFCHTQAKLKLQLKLMEDALEEK